MSGHLQRLQEEPPEEHGWAASPFDADVGATALSAHPGTMALVSCGAADRFHVLKDKTRFLAMGPEGVPSRQTHLKFVYT